MNCQNCGAPSLGDGWGAEECVMCYVFLLQEGITRLVEAINSFDTHTEDWLPIEAAIASMPELVDLN